MDAKHSDFLYLLENTQSSIASLINLRLGQVLTIIDASTEDEVKRKALKDIIKNTFYSEEYWTKDIENYFATFKRNNLKDMSIDKWEAGFWARIESQHPMDDESLPTNSN